MPDLMLFSIFPANYYWLSASYIIVLIYCSSVCKLFLFLPSHKLIAEPSCLPRTAQRSVFWLMRTKRPCRDFCSSSVLAGASGSPSGSRGASGSGARCAVNVPRKSRSSEHAKGRIKREVLLRKWSKNKTKQKKTAWKSACDKMVLRVPWCPEGAETSPQLEWWTYNCEEK